MSSLTVPQGVALSAGAVLGTGVISMPALAAGVAGPASLIAWAALIVLSAPLAWTFAALGARHPDGGGVSTYVGLAFGPRAAAAVGWIFWFAVPLGTPAAGAFAGGYVAGVTGGGRGTVLITYFLILGAVVAMNWFGLRISGRAQLVLSGVLAVLLIVTVVTALPHADLTHLRPFAPHGWAGIGAAAAVLVWGFAGWEAVSSLSADYRRPRRDVPRATMIAVVVVGVLYLAIAVTCVLVLGPALGSSTAPLADLLAVGVGGPVRALTAVIAVLLTIGAVNAYFAGASRLGVSLAAAGALPLPLARNVRRSLSAVALGSCVSVFLPFTLHTVMLLVTGCFTLVYVLGTAAAVRILPRGWSRAVAGAAFLAVLGLLGLTGPPALLSLGIAGAAIVYQRTRSTSPTSRERRVASPMIEATSNASPAASPITRNTDAPRVNS